MTSWNHPLMLPVRIWILLIPPCTWGCLVMYISSSLFPTAAPTHADKQAHRHAQFICSFLLQRTNSGGCRQPVVFPRVSHSKLWLGLALSLGSCTICMLALKPTHAPQRQQFVRLDRCRWEDGGVAPKTSLPKPWEKVKGSLYPTLIWCVRKHWHAPSEKKKKTVSRESREKGDLTAIRSSGEEKGCLIWRFSHIHYVMDQTWLQEVSAKTGGSREETECHLQGPEN